jgi:hypothetical protein
MVLGDPAGIEAELLGRGKQIQGDPIRIGGVVADVQVGQEAESQALRGYKMRQPVEST